MLVTELWGDGLDLASTAHLSWGQGLESLYYPSTVCILMDLPIRSNHSVVGGVNSCPNLLTNLDTGRFRRPGSVRPVSVPSRFRQVISPGVASQANKAGTLPWKPARAPPPSRVCSSAYGPGLDHWDCPPQASPAWRLARQGVDPLFTRKVELEVVVSFWIANATPDKTSDACLLMHYDRHSPHTDTPDIGTLSPTFP
jgi:hypothetical protein